MLKKSWTLAVSVAINISMQLCFVSVHGPREPYFVDEPRTLWSEPEIVPKFSIFGSHKPFSNGIRGIEPVSYRGVLVRTLLHAISYRGALLSTLLHAISYRGALLNTLLHAITRSYRGALLSTFLHAISYRGALWALFYMPLFTEERCEHSSTCH
jgi:hypothetical protein